MYQHQLVLAMARSRALGAGLMCRTATPASDEACYVIGKTCYAGFVIIYVQLRASLMIGSRNCSCEHENAQCLRGNCRCAFPAAAAQQCV